jgi:lipopolysaccharide transport system permease protein
MVPPKVRLLVNFNPLSIPFEMFRFAFFGKGSFNSLQIFYCTGFMIILLLAGIVVFNKWSDKLIDLA